MLVTAGKTSYTGTPPMARLSAQQLDEFTLGVAKAHSAGFSEATGARSACGSARILGRTSVGRSRFARSVDEIARSVGGSACSTDRERPRRPDMPYGYYQ